MMKFIPISERRYASRVFHALFKPAFKENGFVRDGSMWWRVHGGMFLQGIAFYIYPRQKYVTDLVVQYSIRPLYGSFPTAFRATFHESHHRLCEYIPQGYPLHDGACEACSVDLDGLPGERVGFPHKNSVSFYKVFDDIDRAIACEYQFFCENTLPKLDSICSPKAFLEFENGRNWVPMAHIGHEDHIATNLFLRNWSEVRRGIIASSLNPQDTAIESMTKLLSFDGSEVYISSLVGADSYSPEHRSQLVRSILTLQQTELPLTSDATANEHISRVNLYLRECAHYREALDAVLAQDESWAEKRLISNYNFSRAILQSLLPRLPLPNCSISDIYRTHADIVKHLR